MHVINNNKSLELKHKLIKSKPNLEHNKIDILTTKYNINAIGIVIYRGVK